MIGTLAALHRSQTLVSRGARSQGRPLEGARETHRKQSLTPRAISMAASLPAPPAPIRSDSKSEAESWRGVVNPCWG